MVHSRYEHLRILLLGFVVFLYGSLCFQMSKTVDKIDDRLGALYFPFPFFFVWTVALIAPALENFLVFRKEYIRGMYSSTIYFATREVLYALYAILIITIFSCFLYFMTGFQLETSKFFIYLWTAIISYLISVELVLIIIPTISTFSGGIGILATAGFLFDWTSGYWIRKPNIPIWLIPLHIVNPIRLCFDTVVNNEMIGLIFHGTDESSSKTGSTALDQLDSISNNIHLNLIILSAVYIGLVILAYITLKLAIRKLVQTQNQQVLQHRKFVRRQTTDAQIPLELKSV